MARIAAVAIAACLLAGCGSGSSSTDACDEAEEWVAASTALIDHIDGPGDPLDGIEGLIAARDAAEEKFTDAAPGDIADSLRAIRDIGTEPGSEELEAGLIEERQAVDEWVSSTCDLQPAEW